VVDAFRRSFNIDSCCGGVDDGSSCGVGDDWSPDAGKSKEVDDR
jgi:hypothetical protein